MAFAHHVHARTIVLPEHRVLYLPIPKAGCTTLLWLLAGLAGRDAEDFAGSTTPETTPAMTVHDMTVWGPQHRYAGPVGEDWLRFTVLRHPATRRWSAWQSKLLLREPRFVERFGGEDWFPRPPASPAQVLEDFQAFCASGAQDVHWAPQEELVDQLPFDHVGRLEDLDATLALLASHVGPLPALRRENTSALPLPPLGFDGDTRLGYDALPAGDLDAWAAAVEPLLPLLRARLDDRERLDQVLRVNRGWQRRAEDAEADLAENELRRAGRPGARVVANREGEADFTIRRRWDDLDPGFTAVLRVKDEARSLPYVLPPLLRAVRRVVLVDNGSTDGTPAVARRVAAEHGGTVDVHHYPFAVARCGAEHLAAPADSVHSLAYFYNWCFSHVGTRYALKWDGDMVLSDAAVRTLRDLEWQLEAADAIIRIPRYPLYLAGGRRAFLDTGLRNCEPWGWPNKRGYAFVKAMEWELPLWGPGAEPLVLPDRSCVELKHLDADEFAHWSDADFTRSPRQKRKLREWEVYRALTAGAAPPEGVVEIVAPDGVDVVDHVRDGWLAGRAGAVPQPA